MNGIASNLTIKDFMSMFNTNKEGVFSTSLENTHGKMTLTNRGKLRNVDRRDRGRTNYQQLENAECGTVTEANYRVRFALVQALKKGGAPDQWINRLGLGVSSKDTYEMGKTALPLSRRTIKNVLTGFQSMDKLVKKLEESECNAFRGNDVSNLHLYAFNAECIVNRRGLDPNSLKQGELDILLKFFLDKNTHFGNLLKKVRNLTGNAKQEALTQIRRQTENREPKIANSPFVNRLLMTSVRYVEQPAEVPQE